MISTTEVLPRRIGIVVGAVAGLSGLAVAELLSSSSRRLQSPVLDVGDRVIDLVPAWLKNLAIDWFDTKDKLALLVGIGVTLAIYAAAVGWMAARHDRRLGWVGIGGFGALGAWAASASRASTPWWSVLPSLVGAAVAVAVLDGLLALARRRVDVRTDTGARLARRSFLIAASAVVTTAVTIGVAGRWLRGRFSAAESRASVRLPAPADPAAPLAASAGASVAGAAPFYTPNADFYRIDTALTVPQIPAETWRLRVRGMVDRQLELSFDELLSRPLIERDITLTCVSNEIGGTLAGNARWLGIRLDDLLREAGIDSDADQIVGRSVDGYTCGFPVSTLDGRDALIAVGMNGEPLPLEHGFPARLVVPGLYGYVSATKWLTEIELTRFADFDQYWVPRGWDARAPIKMLSRIDTPRGLDTVAGGTVAVAGVAWAQTVGIRRVEVRIDDGLWQKADLADQVSADTWRLWSFAWDAEPGRHTLRVRATDADGVVQTDDRRPPMPNGATGHHQIVVVVGDSR